MIKYLQGDLSLHFIIIGSLPDFLFALSAAFLTFFAEPESIGNGLLIAWHLAVRRSGDAHAGAHSAVSSA